MSRSYNLIQQPPIQPSPFFR